MSTLFYNIEFISILVKKRNIKGRERIERKVIEALNR